MTTQLIMPSSGGGGVGEQGPAGPQGEPGIQGPAGDDGATGAQGPAGDDGATGAQGPAGDDGATGAQGPSGFPDQYLGMDSVSANYTFVLADVGRLKLWNKSSAGDITIPPQVDVDWDDDIALQVLHVGAAANQVRFLGGAGVTVDSGGVTATQPKSRSKGSGVTAIRIGIDSWFVTGDVV